MNPEPWSEEEINLLKLSLKEYFTSNPKPNMKVQTFLFTQLVAKGFNRTNKEIFDYCKLIAQQGNKNPPTVPHPINSSVVSTSEENKIKTEDVVSATIIEQTTARNVSKQVLKEDDENIEINCRVTSGKTVKQETKILDSSNISNIPENVAEVRRNNIPLVTCSEKMRTPLLVQSYQVETENNPQSCGSLIPTIENNTENNVKLKKQTSAVNSCENKPMNKNVVKSPKITENKITISGSKPVNHIVATERVDRETPNVAEGNHSYSTTLTAIKEENPIDADVGTSKFDENKSKAKQSKGTIKKRSKICLCNERVCICGHTGETLVDEPLRLRRRSETSVVPQCTSPNAEKESPRPKNNKSRVETNGFPQKIIKCEDQTLKNKRTKKRSTDLKSLTENPDLPSCLSEVQPNSDNSFSKDETQLLIKQNVEIDRKINKIKRKMIVLRKKHKQMVRIQKEIRKKLDILKNKPEWCEPA